MNGFLYGLILASATICNLSSCQEKKSEIAEPDAPKVSDVFQSQLLKLLEIGTKINAASSEGVSFASFNTMLEDVNGAFELSETMWPDGFASDAQTTFEEALAGWNFARKLWGLKISEEYDFKDGAGMDEIAYEKMPDDFKVMVSTENAGWLTDKSKRYTQVNYDQIPMCLAYSSGKFEKAREALLSALK